MGRPDRRTTWEIIAGARWTALPASAVWIAASSGCFLVTDFDAPEKAAGGAGTTSAATDAVATAEASSASAGGAGGAECNPVGPTEGGPVLAAFEFELKGGSVDSIVPGPDGTVVFLGSGPGSVRSWLHPETPIALAKAFVGTLAADGTLHIRNFPDGSETRPLGLAVTGADPPVIGVVELGVQTAISLHQLAASDLVDLTEVIGCSLDQGGATMISLEADSGGFTMAVTPKANRAVSLTCNDSVSAQIESNDIALLETNPLSLALVQLPAFNANHPVYLGNQGATLCADTSQSCAFRNGSHWSATAMVVDVGATNLLPLRHSDNAVFGRHAEPAVSLPVPLFLAAGTPPGSNLLSSPSRQGGVLSLFSNEGTVMLAGFSEDTGLDRAEMLTLDSGGNLRELRLPNAGSVAKSGFVSAGRLYAAVSYSVEVQVGCTHLETSLATQPGAFIARLPLPDQPYGSTP